jgi:hypothetical protein
LNNILIVVDHHAISDWVARTLDCVFGRPIKANMEGKDEFNESTM